MKLLPTLLALCAAPTLLAAALPPAGTLDGLGMNIHFTEARPGELEMLQAAGVHWVRMDFSWGATERKPGEYDFSHYERLLSDLDRVGMHAMLILDYGNKLYGDSGAVHGEEAIAAYARWTAAVAQHFAGRGVVWEIWNEPNGGFWKPKANVHEYAAVALAASKAFRAATPHELLVGPATSTIDLAFLEECGRAGLYEYWDAVSVHPYRQSGPETAAAEYAKVRRLLARFHPLPIISGEWGYSSAWKNFDSDKQGKMLPREWLTNLANGIPISIWYDWHEDGTNPAEPEHHFGTVLNEYRAGGSPVYEPKPAYGAAQRLTHALAGQKFQRRLAVGGPEDFVLLFGNEQKSTIAYWTTGSPHALPGLKLALTDDPQYREVASAQVAAFPTARPVQLTLEPAGAVARVRVENLSGDAFRAEVELHWLDKGRLVRPVEFAAGEFEKTVEFPLGEKPEGPTAMSVEVRQEGATIARLPSRRYTYLPAEDWMKSTVRADGDAQVGSEQALAIGDAPQPPPSGSAEILHLTYHLPPGWKFLEIQPGGGPAITGEPHRFGMWVYGDGQGGVVRLRVADAAGQIWQPDGGRIEWKGWHYLEFAISSETNHWGGVKEREIHFPLRWDSLLLLDKSREGALSGEIYLASPVVIE